MRTLIAIPCMDMVHTEFMRSCIGMGLSGEVQYTFSPMPRMDPLSLSCPSSVNSTLTLALMPL